MKKHQKIGQKAPPNTFRALLPLLNPSLLALYQMDLSDKPRGFGNVSYAMPGYGRRRGGGDYVTSKKWKKFARNSDPTVDKQTAVFLVFRKSANKRPFSCHRQSRADKANVRHTARRNPMHSSAVTEIYGFGSINMLYGGTLVGFQFDINNKTSLTSSKSLKFGPKVHLCVGDKYAKYDGRGSLVWCGSRKPN